jgi:hypothetical protein
LKAWSHALVVSRHVFVSRQREIRHQSEKKALSPSSTAADSMYELLGDTIRSHSEGFAETVERLKKAGWEVEVPSLETTPGKRLQIQKCQ